MTDKNFHEIYLEGFNEKTKTGNSNSSLFEEGSKEQWGYMLGVADAMLGYNCKSESETALQKNI